MMKYHTHLFIYNNNKKMKSLILKYLFINSGTRLKRLSDFGYDTDSNENKLCLLKYYLFGHLHIDSIGILRTSGTRLNTRDTQVNSQIPYFENILGLVKKMYGLAKITIHWDRSIYRDCYRRTESGWSLMFIPLNAAISLYLFLRLELVAVAPVMQNRDSALLVWR